MLAAVLKMPIGLNLFRLSGLKFNLAYYVCLVALVSTCLG